MSCGRGAGGRPVSIATGCSANGHGKPGGRVSTRRRGLRTNRKAGRVRTTVQTLNESPSLIDEAKKLAREFPGFIAEQKDSCVCLAALSLRQKGSNRASQQFRVKGRADLEHAPNRMGSAQQKSPAQEAFRLTPQAPGLVWRSQDATAQAQSAISGSGVRRVLAKRADSSLRAPLRPALLQDTRSSA